jgi:8-amino-7-oxononanoate synthase
MNADTPPANGIALTRGTRAAAARGGNVLLDAIADETLARLRAQGTWREMRRMEGAQGPRMRVDGRDVLHVSGSNYLDLAHHPEVIEAAACASRDIGCAAGGSRLICGNFSLHETLEDELAAFLGVQASLAFSTGYMANVALLSTLVGPGDVIVSDALNHASIVDGCRLSRAEIRVFDHGSVSALENLLHQTCDGRRRVLLVLDGVYSMDGDVPPLREMLALARAHGALVMLDDAHGCGTLGAHGRGVAEWLGVEDGIDVLVGTLGKTFGSFGAFVAGSAMLRELLINAARPFIFTCALPPPQIAAARAALVVAQREPWRRERLQANAARLRVGLVARGVSTAPSVTHIVPVLIGENARTMQVCERLLARGFFAHGIRHPSVPDGTARLRITPMATHTDAEMDALACAVADELSAL